jgi:hypothetical protein
MSTTYAEGQYDLININVALELGVDVIAPIIPQIDLMLYGTFGLGPLSLDFQARLDAALSITIIPPDVWITGQLQAMAQIIADISAGIVLPGLAINANFALAADLQAKLLGINFLIDGSLALRDIVFGAIGQMEAAANAKIGYLVWSGTNSEFSSDAVPRMITLAAGNGGGTGQVWVIALMFGSQATFNAAATMFLTT